MFQKWKQTFIFGGCVWALLAFTAAQSSSTCGAFFSGNCLKLGWQRLSHFVLFAWVWDYQTLIAGIAALGAGAFVLIATRMQIRAMAEHDRKKEISTLSARLYDAMQTTIDLVFAVLAQSPQIPQYCEKVTSAIPTINRVSPHLGVDITRVLSYILHANSPDIKFNAAQLQITAYILAAMAKYLEENPIVDTPISRSEINIDRKHLDGVVDDFNIELEKLKRYHVYFNMNGSSHL